MSSSRCAGKRSTSCVQRVAIELLPHDLRHTFGSLAVDGGASIMQVKDWMGHADVKTTMRYLHSKNRAADAALLDAAFATGILERDASPRSR